MTVEDEDRLGPRQRERRVSLVRDDADDVVPRGLRRGDAQEQTPADRQVSGVAGLHAALRAVNHESALSAQQYHDAVAVVLAAVHKLRG